MVDGRGGRHARDGAFGERIRGAARPRKARSDAREATRRRRLGLGFTGRCKLRRDDHGSSRRERGDRSTARRDGRHVPRGHHVTGRCAGPCDSRRSDSGGASSGNSTSRREPGGDATCRGLGICTGHVPRAGRRGAAPVDRCHGGRRAPARE